jgi:hypothetical protein
VNVDLSNQKINHRRRDRHSQEPSLRGSSRSTRSRSFRYGSFAAGRQGLRESTDFDFFKPAYGSVQVGEGRYFWAAWRRLSEWLDGAEPLDEGYHTNEVKAHDLARAAVRIYLSSREALAPMPDTWVEAYYQRLMDRELMQEQVARYMALLERKDGTVANGYDELELECGDFAPVDIAEGEQDLDAVEEEAA